MNNESEINWLRMFKLPLQIIALGVSIYFVFFLFKKLDLPTLSLPPASGKSWLQALVAFIVFLVGIGVVAFLWWLSARFFQLLGTGGENADKIVQIKDLPMGLPEGTIRAVLALIVAVVGLPLLLFSSQVGGNTAIAGYINGIITGVFGFYFGNRTAGIPPSAIAPIANAQQSALEQTKLAADAIQEASQQTTIAKQAQLESAQIAGAVDFDSLLDKAQRQLVFAKAVLAILNTPNTLPKELIAALPSDLADTVAKAGNIIDAVSGLSGKDVAPDKLDELKAIADILTRNTSVLSILLGKAVPLVATVVPGFGTVGGIAMLLGIGVKLGSDQFKRWRARVLAAPLAQGLVESGTLTLSLAHAALARTPDISSFFASRGQAETDSVLMNVLTADDPVTVLNNAYGRSGNIAADVINDDDSASIVTALQQSLLALYGAGDITDDIVSKVRAGFSTTASQALIDTKTTLDNVHAVDINNLIDEVSGVSVKPGVPADSAAAFDLLVTLVDTARRENIDMVQAVSELNL
jgi:hypothetical protein